MVRRSADVCQTAPTGNQWFFLTDLEHEPEWHHPNYCRGCCFKTSVDLPLDIFRKLVNSFMGSSPLQGVVAIGRSVNKVQVWTVNLTIEQRKIMLTILSDLTGVEFKRDRESDEQRFFETHSHALRFTEMISGNMLALAEKHLSPEDQLLQAALLKKIQDGAEMEAAKASYAALNRDAHKIDLHEQREPAVPHLLTEHIPKAQALLEAECKGQTRGILIITGRGNGSDHKDSPPIRTATEKYLNENYAGQFRSTSDNGAFILTLNRITSRM